ncbi:MAG: cupin domain-containing protein [Saprospiraceae bacterium]|nr:cupin domain-containing protein [Saprospiraceae bacterium]
MKSILEKKFFFNILVRTSGRPHYFEDCLRSIRSQSYPNYQVLVSYDDPESFEYLKKYDEIQIIPVDNQVTVPPPSRDFAHRVFPPNLYFNSLYKHVRKGLVLFLDDDDQFLDPHALAKIARHVKTPDDILFWRVKFSKDRVVPTGEYFGQAPVYTQINTSGFCFHSRFLPDADWDGWTGGDYFVARKLFAKIPNRIYLDQALTGTQDQNGLAGMGIRNDKAITFTEMKSQFERMGYLPPVRVLSTQEAHSFLNEVQRHPRELPLDWEKGYAAGSRIFYEMATHPAIMERVSAILGPNIILWGCSIVKRAAGSQHHWHCDIEASTPRQGKTLNVWIGLSNTNGQNGLKFLPFSHKFEKTIQQVRYESGVGRNAVTQEQVLSWAQQWQPEVQVLQPDMSDGEALFFDGKVWHGSSNHSGQDRFALLLQYATPDAEIRLLDLNNFDYPFSQLDLPRPPVILIQGDDLAKVNRLVQPPVASETPGSYIMAESRIFPLTLPLELPPPRIWKPYHIFNGTTANMEHTTCHISVLAPGSSPHPPHTHKEEEILIVLQGEADVFLPELPENQGRRKRLGRGDFVYYPAHFQHTIEGRGQEPVNYLMLKWFNQYPSPLESLPFGLYHGLPVQTKSSGQAIQYGILFEGQTSSLRKLHCHTSNLMPGASYEPHADPYDVAILVLEGQIETLGRKVESNQVIFYPAGTTHGMANPTAQQAKYLVFEFHGKHAVHPRQIKPAYRVLENNEEEHQRLTEEVRQLTAENKAIRLSYSLQIGRFITRNVERFLGWFPPIRKILKDMETKN